MTEQFFNGTPLNDVFIFDAHGHLGATNFKTGENVETQGILKTMNALGVDKIALSSASALYGDIGRGNKEVLDAVAAYPDRFYGYVMVNPYYPQEDMLSRFMTHENMLGIKIHAACHKIAIDDESYSFAYEFADKKGLPVLIHTWSSAEVNMAVKVAKRYKNLKIILAHCLFTDYSAKISAIEALKENDNIYADTTLSTTYDGALEWVVDRIGTEKILYGSDMAFFDSRQEIGRIVLSKLTDSQKEKILGLNAKELFF